MSNKDRGKVWLGVAGLVENENGEWLVVMKRYGGLDGMWSLPAGFVQPGETLDQACHRELKEETGIEASLQGLLGLRTGVLRNDISDNMVVFYLTANTLEQSIKVQLDELYDVKWMSPEALKNDTRTSLMILELVDSALEAKPATLEKLESDNIFGYTDYKLYF
ncbi:NUDIX hydrolase [Rummeliibacillus stabekisii]|uniref:NUDIX hydrolase n=1 Tax=Rummeliibacillus stabekisii TaxID=241244 RepID=A0A143HDZ4_9BACL|nr:NUDIX hydrolase [Rummeliibacillus stabekisii]AMW99706.1 NUDIX hydrolase [Rummeliibacillus stabekisii]MCM3317104.1 NUDIX hydrolase [Rummeliibacillus stabekisii]